MITPYPWQIPAIAQLTRVLSRSRGAVDASDVGTGKTFVALFTAKALKLPVAIICPKSLKATWQGACDAVGIKPLYIVSYDKAVKGFEHGGWLNSKDITTTKNRIEIVHFSYIFAFFSHINHQLFFCNIHY